MSRQDPFAGPSPTLPPAQPQKRKRSNSAHSKAADACEFAHVPSISDVTSPHDGSRKRRRLSSNEQDPSSGASETRNHVNGDSVDFVNGAIGSASSASTTSSIFSHQGPITMSNQNGALHGSYNQTPLTVDESSPPGQAFTPRHRESAHDIRHANGHTSTNGLSHTQPDANAKPKVVSPGDDSLPRPQARPGPGKVKGERIAYDPETDSKLRELPRAQRNKLTARWRAFGQVVSTHSAMHSQLRVDESLLTTGKESSVPPPDPRLAIPGYRDGDLGDFRGSAKVWKRKPRAAPYIIPTYSWDSAISIGSGPPTAVVVTGFDPFTSEAQLRMVFGSYGDIAALENKTDPNTGSFLGVCWVRYRDSAAGRGGRLAVDAARKAEKEGTGQRLGLHTVRVERDRIGKRCKRYVDSIARRNEEKRVRELQAEEAKRAAAPPSTPTSATHASSAVSLAPPLNAPRGPSGRTNVRPPEGPRAGTARTFAQSLIEPESVISKIKRKPYLFVPASSVPVMGTTIPHLKKRMKAYDWREVRCDETGYYIIFDDSKAGEDETVRCFKEMDEKPMFTYTLKMECQQYGNPNYERSPSPERAALMKREKEEQQRNARDAEQDWEEEKKSRAEHLDPASAAAEQLRIELFEKIISDLKTKIAAPTLFDLLEPSRHAAKRQELGIPDPTERPQAPAILLASDVAVHGRGLSKTNDHRRQLLGARTSKANVSAFVDERRQKTTKRRPEPLSLHHRLLALHGDDSEDEEKASSKDDHKGDDSRSMSRLSSIAPESDMALKNRRRAVEREDSVRGDESGDDDLGIAKKLLDPHILKKEPEDMAIAELQQVLSSLPPTTRLYKHAQKELKIRQRNRADDRLFLLPGDDVAHSVEPAGDEINVPAHNSVFADSTVLKKKPRKDAKSKKSKKQAFEEREAAKAAAKSAKALLQEEPMQTPEGPPTEDEHLKEGEEEEEEEEEERAEVEWGVSTDVPRRTVEDEPNLVMDIDRWQHVVKDDEDLKFLKTALISQSAAVLGSANAWALGQKDIKRLNVDSEDPTNESAAIKGYYVPNETGSARTEGVKKIMESEKSKYLPHRLRVAAARARRQAEKSNPVTVNAEAAKKAKLVSTANSRQNRANNRTQMKDINTVKQSLIMDGQQGDAIRFNALKKRKKLVKFERSAIHGWGLYADENIALGDMIIEYVGEKVRQAVANIREIRYDKQGMGSSYLFRIDDDSVVDATKKGGIARFINHSCSPNCTAKIIRVEGTKRIVIYALKEIAKDEELTYDYKFDRELDNNDRIPCLCGSDVCKGFLN